MARKQILVIEDDECIREVIQLILVQEEFEITARPSMVDFKDGDQLPDLIILDKHLRNQLGSDICTNIKNNPATSSIPVILMSADNNVKDTARICGADTYIKKPFDIDDLVDCVKSFFTGNRYIPS
jgi:two-component system phosphate regulon response regulator PhoB